MANISAAQVKDLREKTGAPMMDCKQALTEAKGDMEQAVVILRKKGVSVAAKKATRVTSEGSVTSYIHAGGKIGVLVEVNCESDFVARTDDFKELAHDIAMHIAASDPKYVRKEDVTEADFAREKDIFLDQAVKSGKPQNIAEKMVVDCAAHRGEDRQAGREHQRAALRALQGGRCECDGRNHETYGTES
jgi:elongation factor Ts